MTPTKDQPPIHAALAAVMAQVRAVAKDSVNEAQRFRFRGIDAVLNAVGPALRDHGVVCTPHLQDITTGTIEIGGGNSRRPIGHVLVQVTYRFTGPAGDNMECTVPGEAMDAGDKAVSKAMSVAYRTALLQALCLPTDEADPDHDVYERAPQMTEKERRAVAWVAARAVLDAASAVQSTTALRDLWAQADRDGLLTVAVDGATVRDALLARVEDLKAAEAQQQTEEAQP